MRPEELQNNEPLEITLHEDADFQLSEIDADAPTDILNESSAVILPLPDQDRESIEKQLKRNQRFKISLMEMLVCISFFCVLLALSNWLPFEIYTVGVGCIAGFVMLGLFNWLIIPRYRMLMICIMLPTYIVSAIWLIWRS